MCNLNVRIILTFPFARGVDIFRQQKLDPRQQFKNFACGLVSSSCTFYGTDPDNRLAQFEHWRHSDGLWRRDLQFPECIYNEDEEAQNIKPESVLNYPLDSDDLFDPSGYDAPGFFPTELDKTSRSPLRVMWVHHASIRDASH